MKDGDKILRVAVHDTGVGIPKSDQSKLFKLFGFIDNKNSAMNSKGIGLGLVIARGICQQFGGTIRVTSIPEPEEDHGSTFEFSFKLQDQPLQEGEEMEGSVNAQSVYRINCTQLVFDHWKPNENWAMANLLQPVVQNSQERRPSMISRHSPITRRKSFEMTYMGDDVHGIPEVLLQIEPKFQ
jgi:hypothetical protein